MKFGLILPNFGPTADGDAIRRCAALAEDQGFDSVWTTDHVLMPASMPDPYGNLLESLIALTLAAAVTERVRLGTSIIVTPQREPVLLAKQLASIDAISGGRLILGAGVGWLEQEFSYLQANYENRGARFDEGLALARALWAGEGGFQGEFAAIDDALFSPFPAKGRDLPVWIGGNSARAIRRAATIADGWHPVGLTAAELEAGCASLRSQANGRPVTVSLRTNIELLATGETPRGYQAPGHAPSGSAVEIVRELRDYQEAGLEYAVVWLFHGTGEELESRSRRFAAEVMPNFS